MDERAPAESGAYDGERRNVAAIERYYRAWASGEANRLAEFLAPEFVGHDPSDGPPFDHAGLGAWLATFAQALPDFRVVALDTIAQSDRVVMRWRTEATFTGPFMGHPPTGATVQFGGITIYRLRNGKIAELWNEFDRLTLLTAVGAITTPG